MNRFRLWYSGLPPVVRTLMTIQVVVYVTCMVLLALNPAAVELIRNYLAIPGGSPLTAPWTIFTHAFVHTEGGLGGLLHVGFNVAFLYWIGDEQERLIGGAWVLTAWGLGAIGGGLVALLLGVPFEGSSAAVLGLIFATALQFPYKTIGLLLLGAVRLLWVGVGLLVLESLSGLPYLFIGAGGSALGAAMGALALRGYHVHGWIEGVMNATPRKPQPTRASAPRREPVESEPSSGGWRGLGERLSAPKGPKRPTRHEVDRILDKISEQGRDALTDDELATLEAYSKR
jgi:membrane associated rhomboid family serine protease